MGPVTPLLAVWREMKRRRPELGAAWVGTPEGPERIEVEKEGIRFFSLPVVKIPRYPSIRWITWPFAFFFARRKAAKMLAEIRPSLVVSAGGFTSVPVIRAARLRRIPCAIHQLDAEPGLSNIAVARVCQSVTTSFRYDFPPFQKVQSEQMPTPSRFAGIAIPTKEEAGRSFGLDPARPVVFIVGGGTGSKAVNDAVGSILGRLLNIAQVIHLTGKGKSGGRQRPGYVVADFFDESAMLRAYAAADIVVSRAGMGGITDAITLKKATILVPIPRSHQEQNVRRLPFAVVQQGDGFPDRLLKQIEQLLEDAEARRLLAEKIGAALPVDNGSTLAERWLKLVGK